MENKEEQPKGEITASGCVAGLQFIIAVVAVCYGIYVLLSM
jgi:hypothetical protein